MFWCLGPSFAVAVAVAALQGVRGRLLEAKDTAQVLELTSVGLARALPPTLDLVGASLQVLGLEKLRWSLFWGGGGGRARAHVHGGGWSM